MSTSSTILDHPLVSSRYFFPRRDPIPDPHWVEAADGSKLACYYQAVNPDAKTVVYFHGNGEVVADYLLEFPAWITRAGCNCVLAEYRGYGMSTGHPALAGMLEDVAPIIQSLNIPDHKIVLFGRSIGSLYALHGVYQRPQIAGLIIESGVADLTQRFFQRVLPEELGMSTTDVVDELRKYFDYAQKLGSFQGQTLVTHTRFDELIAAHHAEMLYTAAREPKQLKIFDRGGHNDIFFRNRTEYMQLVEAFLAAV
ncbi:MAG TPA: alpha/beta hydrolase [Candidatus Binatia bacterium]|nr:alpha/beta hydrolase [Candidatus Binatia bacterium]